MTPRVVPGRPAAPYSQKQIGVRLPADLVRVLDTACRTRGVKRSALVIAALRKHLGKPDPAEVAAAGEKP